MKKESEDKTQNTKSFQRFDLLIVLLCGFLILACFISSFFPKSRLWGINHLAYFPLWVRLVFTILGLSILIPWFNSKVYNLLDKILTLLQSIFAKRKILGYTFLSLVFMFFFWLIRTKTYFLGDGYNYLSYLKSERYTRIGFEPLEIFTHLYAYKFLKLFFTPSTEFIYAGLSIFAGGVFIFTLFFFTKTISEDRFDRYFIFAIILFSGATELFLGYAEHYTLTYVTIFAYLYFSLRYLQGKAKIYLPIFLCALSIWFHFSCAYLLPSLFFLFILKKRKGEFVFSLKKAIPYLLILIFLFILFVYYIYGIYPALSQIFVPVLKGRPEAPGYTLFSISHLLDILNQHLLLSSVGVILLLSIVIIYKNRIKFKDPNIVFLLLASLAQLSYHFLVDPELGAGRDWDFFASMGIGYTLLGIYLFINLTQSKRYSGLVLIFTTLLCSLPFFLLNANTNRSIERFKNLPNLDLEQSLNGRWNLSNYYFQKGLLIEFNQIKTEIYKLFPGDSLTREAQVYIKSGDYDKATILLKNAIELDPNFHITYTAYHELGNIYLLQGQIDEALNVYSRLVRLNTLDPLIHMHLGHTLLLKERLDEALIEFKKAEKLGLKEPGAFCDIAYIYLRIGETGKAIKAYKKALKLNPEYFYPHFGLGQIYLERNSLDEALIEFDQSKMLKSDFASTYYNLGVIYSRKGLKEKAIENYELFLKYSKDETQNEKVRGLIQQLRSQSP